MGQIDRSRRRRGCAGSPRHKICTASLDNAPLIDGFVCLISRKGVGRQGSVATRPCLPLWLRSASWSAPQADLPTSIPLFGLLRAPRPGGYRIALRKCNGQFAFRTFEVLLPDDNK